MPDRQDDLQAKLHALEFDLVETRDSDEWNDISNEDLCRWIDQLRAAMSAAGIKSAVTGQYD
jgi:hypothetical protein